MKIQIAAVVKILPVKVRKRLITRKQRHHVLLNVMMLPWYVLGISILFVTFPYYLVKLNKDPFTTTECVKDEHGHYIPKIIERNYYKIFK